MPLARIITRHPQETIAASEYLRSQGYTVETVSPEEFRVTPADFELNLEKCGPEEALARAKALLESPQGAVPVAAGPEPVVPQKVKVAVAYDIAGRPVEFVDEEEVLPERRQRPNTFASALVSLFARAKQGIAAGLIATWESVSKPVAELRRERAEQRALRLEAELAQDREEVRYQEELARERLRQEMERQREAAERAERQRQERIAAEREAEERRRIAAETAAAEAAAGRQRIEAARAAALAAQQEQERIEAERQAAALRDQQEAAMARARAAAQQRDVSAELPEGTGTASVGAVLPPAVEAALPPKPATSHAIRQQAPRRSAPRVQPFVLRRPRTPIRISRKAVVTALGASLLVVLGFVAFANRRGASPLSPGALMKNDSVKQETPFGAATITPPPAIAPKPKAARTAVAPAKAKSSPTVRSAAQKPRATRRSARRLRPRSEEDVSLAEDEVVVRHLQSPRPRPQPTAANAKLKQYSDMD